MRLPLDAGSIVRAGFYALATDTQRRDRPGGQPCTDGDGPAGLAMMSPGELEAIVTRTCTSKQCHDTRAGARRAAFAARARRGGRISAYRCPFGDGTRAGAHWHIGRVPSLASLERIALAVRQRAQGASSVAPEAPAVTARRALPTSPEQGRDRVTDARVCARGDHGWCAVVASNAYSAMPVCGVGINFPDYDHREPDCPDCVAALADLHSQRLATAHADELRRQAASGAPEAPAVTRADIDEAPAADAAESAAGRTS